nr:uncharacterized protein LOC127310730 [Lolium perenne]
MGKAVIVSVEEQRELGAGEALRRETDVRRNASLRTPDLLLHSLKPTSPLSSFIPHHRWSHRLTQQTRLARPSTNAAHVPGDSVHEGRSCCVRRITEGREVHSRNQKAELLTTDDTHDNAINSGRRRLPQTATNSEGTESGTITTKEVESRSLTTKSTMKMVKTMATTTMLRSEASWTTSTACG